MVYNYNAQAQSVAGTTSNATIDQSTTNDTDVTQSSSTSATTTQNQTINGTQVNNTYINPDRAQASITQGGRRDLLRSGNRSITGDGDRDGRYDRDGGKYDGRYNGNYDRGDKILGGGLRRDESRDPTIIRPSKQAERATDAIDRQREFNRATTGSSFDPRTSGIGSVNNNANPIAESRDVRTGNTGMIDRRVTGSAGTVDFVTQPPAPIVVVPPVSNAPAYDANNAPRSGPGYGRYRD